MNHEWRAAAYSGAGARANSGEYFKGPPSEAVALERASGRTLATALAAKRTQPPKAVSAMDGYAVRAEDLAELPVKLKQIGESTAGHGFSGSIGPKETVRIFTGAPVPDGCDTILIQENAREEAGLVEPLQSVASGRNIRAKGIDFAEGEVLLAAGTRLGASNIALAAAMNFAEVTVTRRPRVGILATGDELVRPGETIGADQIVATNSFAIAALVEAAGGEAVDLGIARDDLGAIEEASPPRAPPPIFWLRLAGPPSAIMIWSNRRLPGRVWNCIFGGSRCGPENR